MSDPFSYDDPYADPFADDSSSGGDDFSAVSSDDPYADPFADPSYTPAAGLGDDDDDDPLNDFDLPVDEDGGAAVPSGFSPVDDADVEASDDTDDDGIL